MTRSIEKALRSLGSRLDVWQLRALFLGAQASTAPSIAPPDLLERICGRVPQLGKDLADANANLESLLEAWNQLAEADHVELSRSPNRTKKDLAALAKRHTDEILWFIRGLDAAGSDPLEFGPRGSEIFRDLAETSNFLEEYRQVLAKSGLAEARAALDELTTLTEMLMEDLLELSGEVREEALREFSKKRSKKKQH
jgi:hypothetical protein